MKWEPHENPKRTEYVVELEREVERLRARIEQIGASHVEAIRLARIDAAERMRESILDRVDQFFYVRAYSHSLCAQIRALPLPGAAP